MLAAVPSVIIGLWGIIVLGPVPALDDRAGDARRARLDPDLRHRRRLPGAGVFTAMIVLAIMALPIIAAITRDLFLTVPDELKDGALALGATRWEMIRGVVLSSMRPGIASACILGLSRALGEAIAVAAGDRQRRTRSRRTSSIPATRSARSIALQAIAHNTQLETAIDLLPVRLILLVIELLVNLLAQAIVRHYQLPDVTSGGASSRLAARP